MCAVSTSPAENTSSPLRLTGSKVGLTRAAKAWRSAIDGDQNAIHRHSRRWCRRPMASADARPRRSRRHALRARGIALWQATYPCTVTNGTVVTALNRDRAELDRFARLTEGHRRLSAEELATLEPALTGRFAGALYYPDEAHLA